ncbi:MAG: hypothetical protein KDA98_16620, partial [Acidimicrobiales bacterium]|nr:hypothetical protein [Acidimicrobiales bacterium]
APALPLARRRVEGRCEELAVADLEFDDEELGIAGAAASGDHARWPALARLARADRPDATVDYLLEEVATDLGPDRLAALSALSLVGTVDDELACAASEGRADASDLLDELPLVQRSTDRTMQLHDLWSAALVGARPLDGETGAALSRVAAEVRRRGQHREAAELFARAGDVDELERTCVDYVSRPLMFTAASELQSLAALVGDALPGRPIAELLNATVPIVGDEQRSVDAFTAVAAAAREAGDPAVETIALQNVTNLMGMIDPSGLPAEVAVRADALAAAGEPRARSLRAIVRSFEARAAAEPEACARHLAELDPSRSVVDQIMFAFGMGDLGRPEDVAAPIGETDPTSAAARAGGQYLAQAMWLRGDVSPEVALEYGTQLVDVTDSRGVAHVRISTSSVLALVALAAGDVARAREFVDAARELTSQTVSRPVKAFAHLADAATVLHERGEDEAARALADAFAVQPLRRWPARPYLYALPLVYLLAPQHRDDLDACRFGPALTMARDAGQALVALRERGDEAPAAALGWHRRELLRAHLLPPHLVELAATAAAAGSSDAQALLDEVPHQRERLVEVGARGGPGAGWARDRTAALPARPAHDVRVEVLGPMRCWRGGTEVTDAPWARRERVRQLLALLVLH